MFNYNTTKSAFVSMRRKMAIVIHQISNLKSRLHFTEVASSLETRSLVLLDDFIPFFAHPTTPAQQQQMHA